MSSHSVKRYKKMQIFTPRRAEIPELISTKPSSVTPPHMTTLVGVTLYVMSGVLALRYFYLILNLLHCVI